MPDTVDPKIEAMALRGVVTMERLFHAQTKLELWRARYDHASTQIDRYAREVKELEAKNRGIDPESRIEDLEKTVEELRRKLEAARAAPGRCTVCGSRRIRKDDGSYGACSLVPGRDGTGGCPHPLHDVMHEQIDRAREDAGKAPSDA
jgi:hypothetical protein